MYRVIPLPRSLLPLVWDFGELSSETEYRYIVEIIHVHINTENYERLRKYCDAIAKALSNVQNYMRERRDECSFVSLRDVERTVRVMLWFYDLIPKLHLNTTGMCRITYSLILSIAVCYRAKLRDRANFDSYLTSSLVVPLSTFTESFVIKIRIDQCQTRIVDLMRNRSTHCKEFCLNRESVYDVCLHSVEDSSFHSRQAWKLKVSSEVYHQSFF